MAAFTANRAMSYGMHTVAVRAFDAAGPASSAAVTVMRVRSGAQTNRVATSSAQLNASTDGTLYARQSADGLCVLRIKPFGEA
jgi:hypothetical protein